MSIDKMALLAIQSLQSASGAGASVITRNMVTALWPELQSFLWKRYGPAVMTKFVYPLARRTALPLAKKVGMPLARRYGVPLAQKTGRMVWRKVAQPAARKFFPSFFAENNGGTPSGEHMSFPVLAETPEMTRPIEGSSLETFPKDTQTPLREVSRLQNTPIPQEASLFQNTPTLQETSLLQEVPLLQETPFQKTPFQETPQSYHQSRLGRHMGMGMLSRRLMK